MTNQIIEVPDISVIKTVNGEKQRFSLRDQKVKKDSLHDFGIGSGVKYQGDLYVLDNGNIPIVRMTTANVDPSFSVVRSGDIEVDWGDGVREKNVFKHTYTDMNVSHYIVFYGSVTVLKALVCRSSELFEIDISRNIFLERLDCSNNELLELDISQNVSLKYLNCINNQLSILDVSQNTLLRILACGENLLSKIDVSQNVALTGFYCEKNHLSEINVLQNSELIYFNLYDNQLFEIDISRNGALIQLLCQRNRLFELDVTKNVALTIIDCSGNALVTDQASLVALAYSLPHRDVNDNALLGVGNNANKDLIRSICDTKNWRI